MPLGWSELALLAVIAWLILRPWSRAVRDDPPKNSLRGWTVWSMGQRFAAGVGIAALVGYLIYRDYQWISQARNGRLAEVVTILAIAAVYLVVRRVAAR
jgi:hypothetical protein